MANFYQIKNEKNEMIINIEQIVLFKRKIQYLALKNTTENFWTITFIDQSELNISEEEFDKLKSQLIIK